MKGRFAKLLRKLRIDNDEYLKDMAEKLGVSISFLSAVENNTKSIPATWIPIIIEKYGLDERHAKELEDAFVEDSKNITISVDTADEKLTDLAVAFARYRNALSDETVRKMIDMMKKKEGEEDD